LNTPISPIITSRLEKVAIDNGFDVELPRVLGGDGRLNWLGFVSTQCPLRIWLGMFGDNFVTAFSRQNVTNALSEFGTVFEGTIPIGASGARCVSDIPALHHLVRRAFQLSKTLPDELLHVFVKATASLPRTTEAERVVVQRVGQDIFRSGLIEYWEGTCAITGLAIADVLRASHIKPWADCESDRERLDVYNGFLLAPHLDAAFDRGLITVTDEGVVMVSSTMGIIERRILGVLEPLRVRSLADEHRAYLVWHRTRVFQS
jgi:putative restriction endonuclease